VIEPPLWLVILPIAASPLVYLTRRWFVGALLAALVAFFSGLLAWNFPPTNPIRLMGRIFLLDSLTQHALALLFFMAAILFLAAWRLPQGGAFYPLGLVLLGLFAADGMSRHLGISAIIMALAAITAAPIVQGGQSGSTRAAWRLLAMMMLALPFFLLASWRVDLYRDDVENVVYLGQAAIFLGLGMAIWLAVVPLHGWLTGVGAEAPSLAAALVLTGFPLLALVTMLQVLTEATWFTWHQQLGQALLIAGLISVGLGGLLAAVQRGLRPLFGYAALFDMGCLLTALAIGGDNARLVFYTSLAIRALALGLTGTATATVRQGAGRDAFAGLQGAAYRMPLATAALIIGGFTLAGLPLTAGFYPRWLLLRDLSQVDTRYVWLLVIAGVGVAIGYLRGLNAMLASPKGQNQTEQAGPAWPAMIFLVALGLLSVGLAIYPDPLLQAAQRLLTAYPLPPL
jgi:formate hydrogenlyase subunit 3/multisubunit Na+/H+ antiporter MnhD subunit